MQENNDAMDDDDEVIGAPVEEKEESERDKIEQYIDQLPTFSPATKKILELSQQLNAPANEIVKAIRMDPVLTSRVLKLINSAYFSLADKITSLNRAVVYLGINTIKNLALSSAVIDVVDTKNANVAKLVKPIWKHSLATAVCVKSIAKFVQVPKELYEEFFIAGLLHDLGKIVLIQCFPEKFKADLHMSIEEEENSFQINHTELGEYILQKWKFTEDLSSSIRHHHEPTGKNKFPYFIHLANAMTYRLNLNDFEEDKIPNLEALKTVDKSCWEKLQIEEAKLLKALENVGQEIEKAEIFLKINE